MADNVLAQVPRKRYPTLDEQMRSDIVNYLSRLKSDFVTSGERAGQGLGQVIDDGNYLEGVPRVVLGGLGALSAPVSAAVSPVLGPLLQPVGEAVDTYVGQPVERATGYPADITNELFLTGVTAGAAPVLRPALRGSGNFLAKMGDAAEAGLNRVGYTARPQEGVRFTFGGPMALTADKAKLAQAQKMAADGLSRDEIWKQTGWFQGVDGKWRFEIDDSNFNLRQNILEQHQNSRIGSTLTVGLTDAIDAPDLLSAYNLGDTTLDLSRLSKGGIGGFDRAKNSIELMAAPDADIMRRGLLHEVQHLIQQKEGFTGGGDPSKLGADKYKRLGGEVEARNVEARRNFTPAQRSAITPWATQDVPFEGQHLATAQQGLQRSGFGSVKLDDALDSSPEAVAQRAYDQGFRIDAYTGANRLDRLVQGIDPQRATSGPMPYFTDAPDLASQYAVNKIDNSAIRELGDWDTQFTVGGKPLSQFSKSLTPMQKRDLAARFENIGLDDDGNVVTTVGQPGGANLDHWKYLLKYHKGDPIAAAKELWLESGQIFGNESDFATVLQKAGLNDVEFDSPNISYPGVLPAKLKIENPLITTDRTTLRDLLPELEKAAQSAPKPQYTSGGVDQWDKTTLDPADWIERYRTDLQNGTAHAWTVVPDWVTEFLKSRGFDGIKDVGGKMGGSPHTVWIPFSPEQVRSRFARFDPKNIGKAGLSLGVAGGVGLANQEENGSAIYRQMEGRSGGT